MIFFFYWFKIKGSKQSDPFYQKSEHKNIGTNINTRKSAKFSSLFILAVNVFRSTAILATRT